MTRTFLLAVGYVVLILAWVYLGVRMFDSGMPWWLAFGLLFGGAWATATSYHRLVDAR